MNELFYEYKGQLYPDYLKRGNAVNFIKPFAEKFCIGNGLDIGCGDWPLSWAQPIEKRYGGDAMNLPEGPFDYVFSSHCLEHLPDTVSALEHWQSRLKQGGVIFLYLPHPDMEYWLPQNCRKHLHSWYPEQMAALLRDIGFVNVIHSQRDLAWGFAVVGVKA
jgi:SAM-dependent methyltransferase